jgi:hypothetical protein
VVAVVHQPLHYFFQLVEAEVVAPELSSQAEVVVAAVYSSAC